MIEVSSFQCETCSHIHSVEGTFMVKSFNCRSITRRHGIACDLHNMGLHSRDDRRIPYEKAWTISGILWFRNPKIIAVQSVLISQAGCKFYCLMEDGVGLLVERKGMKL